MKIDAIDAHPQQRHHRETEDLPQREQPVFQYLQYVQRRLHREKRPPVSSAAEATASVHIGMPVVGTSTAGPLRAR